MQGGQPDPSRAAMDGLISTGLSRQQLNTVNDRALMAFAQLATHRLDVNRCTISLLDNKNQYVLTEATRTLSLISLTAEDDDDQMFLGASVMDPHDLICEHAFTSSYTVTDDCGNEHMVEAFVVNDLAQHDLFKNRSYVAGDPHIRFYAGVPIISSSGYKIGVYSVTDFQPRNGLTLRELRFMREMADTVMEHLEMTRDREDRNKGERMVRGLAEFIEGSCALGKSSLLATESTAPKPLILPTTNGKTTTNTTSVIERQTQNIHLLSMEDDDLSPQLDMSEPVSRLSGPKATKTNPHPAPSNPTCIFYRAADLIRKSTFADGAVFFRASGLSNRSSPSEAVGDPEQALEDSYSGTSGSDMYGPAGKLKSMHRSKSISKDKDDIKNCEVLGLSVSEHAPGEERLCVKEFSFAEKSMERYIKKFPFGKFFSFTEHGSGVSSGDDKSEVEGTPDGPVHYQKGSDNLSKPSRPKQRQKFIPTELLKILPGIRSLIFLPLWDPAAERWIAGGFIWTSKEGALTNPDNELPYLKAFGNSIASEYARMNALIADRAKTSFIASVSHELRSPLHGILGSVEFLNETDATTYQTGLISSIETCGKVLLETLDHVLDYAKINKLNSRNKTSRRFESRVARRENESSIMGPYAEIDLNSLIEEVCEAVCAGHAFRETHTGTFTTSSGKSNPASNLGHVSVSVEVSPRLKSLVRTQPGAVQRIVMNLLGNSLKYTSNGFIAVLMDARPSPFDPSKVVVVLTVQDSGKGMSLEYQRTRLFSPFSQEDPFSDGTGLGLSIVRQIIDSLGGNIEIQSTQGVGTKVEVHLTLPIAEGQETDDLGDARDLAKGKKLCLLSHTCTDDKMLAFCGRALVENSLEWFDLEIVEGGEDVENLEADAVICPETSVFFSRMNFSSPVPIVVVCKNQTDKMALRKRLIAELPPSASKRLEIVAQPLGPQKLGNAFKRIFSSEHFRQSLAHPRTLSGAINLTAEAAAATAAASPPLSQSTIAQQHAPLESANSLPPPTLAHTSSIPEPRRTTTSPIPVKPNTQTARPIPIRLKSGFASEQGPHSSHHVLLVDDNNINLQLLVMFMKKISLPYASAVDGLQALDKYKSCAASALRRPPTKPITQNSPTSLRHPPQPPTSPTHATAPPTTTTTTANGSSWEAQFTFVLMDISMPVMDGLESTRRIRAFERDHGLKKAVIIALTGLASAEAQRDALDAGVDFYLPKPVRFADLKRLLDV